MRGHLYFLKSIPVMRKHEEIFYSFSLTNDWLRFAKETWFHSMGGDLAALKDPTLPPAPLLYGVLRNPHFQKPKMGRVMLQGEFYNYIIAQMLQSFKHVRQV